MLLLCLGGCRYLCLSHLYYWGLLFHGPDPCPC